MRTPLVLVLVLAVSACATGPTKEEKDAAMGRLTACLSSAIDRIDDGTTDPLSVARAAAGSCALERSRAVEVATSGMAPRQAYAYESGMNSVYIDSLASVVMERRAQKR